MLPDILDAAGLMPGHTGPYFTWRELASCRHAASPSYGFMLCVYHWRWLMAISFGFRRFCGWRFEAEMTSSHRRAFAIARHLPASSAKPADGGGGYTLDGVVVTRLSAGAGRVRYRHSPAISRATSIGRFGVMRFR